MGTMNRYSPLRYAPHFSRFRELWGADFSRFPEPPYKGFGIGNRAGKNGSGKVVLFLALAGKNLPSLAWRVQL